MLLSPVGCSGHNMKERFLVGYYTRLTVDHPRLHDLGLSRALRTEHKEKIACFYLITSPPLPFSSRGAKRREKRDSIIVRPTKRVQYGWMRVRVCACADRRQ